MNEAYTLHRQPLRSRSKPRPAMPGGLVYMVGRPEVGSSLVLVGEECVVQTGVVRKFECSEDTLVVETDNSQYTLRVAA